MDFSDSVMIALLPIRTDWCKIELPHMTLVYAGRVGDLSANAKSSLAKDAASLAIGRAPIVLDVIGLGVFGDVEKVDVLRLQPTPELLAMRKFVEGWNASEHPFNPHVTIGPNPSGTPPYPNKLAFNKIMVGWGNESITFELID